MTNDSTVVALRQPDDVDDPLTAVLRSGARRLLAQAIEAEAEAFLAGMKGMRLPDGRERVVRHGLASAGRFLWLTWPKPRSTGRRGPSSRPNRACRRPSLGSMGKA